jgi:nicotinamidase-related amidase
VSNPRVTYHGRDGMEPRWRTWERSLPRTIDSNFVSPVFLISPAPHRRQCERAAAREAGDRGKIDMIKRVLIDVSTQSDFLSDSGAFPVINREQLLPNLRRAMAWARVTHTTIVSALEARHDNEPFNGTPRHCVDGTPGQEKIPFTLLSNRTFLQVDNSLSMPKNLLGSFQQIILRKGDKDFLGNPKADRLLTESAVGEYVILGVGLETAIKSLALGLMARMKRVAVVYDACGFWNVTAADLALRKLEAKGARLICVEELCFLRRRYPGRNGNGHGNGNGNGRKRHLANLNDPSIPVPALVRARLAAMHHGSA